MPQITIPSPANDGPIVVRMGKRSRQWDTVDDAVDWAKDVMDDRAVLFATAILLAKRRPATRGKTLDYSPGNNIILSVS